MEINIFQVDTFTDTAFGGNPAAVVPNAVGLSEYDMQKIANEMNVSETAFVVQIDDSLYRVRYFTPTSEVDLCGHGSIATFHTLALKGYIKPIDNGIKIVTQLTKAGKLPLELHFKDGIIDWILMEQAPPKSLGVVDNLGAILESMNLRPDQIGVSEQLVVPEIISTGLPDIILPLKSKEDLDNLEIDYCNLGLYTSEINVIGVHAFYLPNPDSNVVYTRNFAPSVGINEEAATGTSNGALIYFLKKNNLISGNSIISIQGDSLNRPSQIHCYIEKYEDSYKVKVGGKAKIVIDGIITF